MAEKITNKATGEVLDAAPELDVLAGDVARLLGKRADVIVELDVIDRAIVAAADALLAAEPGGFWTDDDGAVVAAGKAKGSRSVIAAECDRYREELVAAGLMRVEQKESVTYPNVSAINAAAADLRRRKIDPVRLISPGYEVDRLTVDFADGTRATIQSGRVSIKEKSS